MNFLKFVVTYKYLNKSFEKKRILWALNYLKKIASRYKINISLNKSIEDFNKNCIVLINNDNILKQKYYKEINLSKKDDAFAILPYKNKIIIYANNYRGFIYAITEIVDIIKFTKNNKLIIKENIIEEPITKIRSISKCFESVDEDDDWFYNKKSWEEYLTLLISERFNRFTLTLGMQYNYPYGNEFIKDVYLYLPYPFLVSPKGYDIKLSNFTAKERKRNLDIIKFIAKESKKRGLEFQIAIWTQRYDFDNVPNANFQILKYPKGLNYARYCRDSLSLILKECPEITGVTLRVHVECGIPERKYSFWKTYFQAIKKCGRSLNLDLHAKGIDEKLIKLALKNTEKLSISPKYISEHMGLPYHQASIRKQELPPKKRVSNKWTFSEGSRKFLRYSYGDLLKENREYDILYRIWPGTQRILLWADHELASGYGKLSTFCNSLGTELCEPLSFKGRMGTGIKGGRYNYKLDKLRTKYDWQKYVYNYRIWGRLNYNPNTKKEIYLRYLSYHFGSCDKNISNALANASRVLPFITLVHGVSASNNSYWPEIYENMSIVKKAPWLPYSYDLHKNSRFGMSTSCDPQLIMSPKEMVDKIFKNKPINKYSPLTMILWLEKFSKNAKKFISRAASKIKNKKNYEFQRIYIDVIIQSSIGKFFTYKFRASILWEYYLLSKNKKVGEEALNNYLKARNAWKVAAVISKKYYLPDLSYGPQSWLRGRWDDRLPAINQDIDDMRNILIKNKYKYKKNKKDLELIDYVRNWKNNQNISVKHLPPKNYIKGERISLSCKLNMNKKLLGYINYREVNQSKKWIRKKLIKSKGIYSSVIPSRFTNTQYPIQYYFEFANKKHSSFYPGFNSYLSNQPYYLLRQEL